MTMSISTFQSRLSFPFSTEHAGSNNPLQACLRRRCRRMSSSSSMMAQPMTDRRLSSGWRRNTPLRCSASPTAASQPPATSAWRMPRALIALLDQDDAWYPHHLETLAEPFRKRRGIPLGWVYSNLDEIDESGRMVNNLMLDRRIPAENPKRSLTACLSHDLFILPSASLIRREAFEAVGGFDERLCG